MTDSHEQPNVGEELEPERLERLETPLEGTTHAPQEAGELARERQHSALRPVRTYEEAAELGRKSGAARRARKEARERAAELDRLTLAGRTAVVLAKTCTAARLEAAVVHLLDLAAGKNGTKDSAAVSATRALTHLLRLGFELPTEDEEADISADIRSMTPAQRASVRAELLRQARAAVEDAEAVEAEHISST